MKYILCESQDKYMLTIYSITDYDDIDVLAMSSDRIAKSLMASLGRAMWLFTRAVRPADRHYTWYDLDMI